MVDRLHSFRGLKLSIESPATGAVKTTDLAR
jgi:hypothetical protein